MSTRTEFIIGTSGYSFADWVGTFYPDGTAREAMFGYYTQHFAAVELNFSYYRLPTIGMMGRFADKSPDGFRFWVKANQETTHKQNRSVAAEFNAALEPLAEVGKLAGVLLQFPQSFHRTVANRKYLAAALEDLAGPAAAVEFRHHSWAAPATAAGLRERGAILVVPDVPNIAGLYRSGPAASGPTGYLRLHSRNAELWYGGGAKRYDYSYSDAELERVAADWSDPALELSQMFVFFNNCHRGQAASNAAAFQRIVDRMASGG